MNQIVSIRDENPIAEPMPMSKDEVQAEVEKGQAVLTLAIVPVSQAVQPVQTAQAVEAEQTEVQPSEQTEPELLGGTSSKPYDDDQKQGEQKQGDVADDDDHDDESTKIAAMKAAKAAAEESL